VTTDERLAAMHDTLRHLLDVIRVVADDFSGDFAPESPARSEWEQTPGVLGHDLQEAFRTSMVLWHTINDHGNALCDLIVTRRTYAAVTVARSLAEAAGRSWYLLSESVEPLERVRRLINDRLYAGFENEQLLIGTLPASHDPEPIHTVAQRAEPVLRQLVAKEQVTRSNLLDKARGYDLRPIKEGDVSRRRTPYVGTSRPATTAVLGQMFGADAQPASFYRFNSAVAHASLHAQPRMLSLTQGIDGTTLSAVLAMNPDDLSAQAWLSVAAVAVTSGVLFRQAGWPTDELDAALNALVPVWNPPPSPENLAEFDHLTRA
jgi:hypothetical protein